jgi:hypothetical protein
MIGAPPAPSGFFASNATAARVFIYRSSTNVFS